MRTSLLVDVGRMELCDVPSPRPGPRDALVEVSAVGLCGTDFHIFSGESNFNLDARGVPVPLRRSPQVLGHEITGVVREVGGEVRDLRPGERVVIDQGINCVSTGRERLCEYCASGDSHQCEWYAEHGISGLPGGLAELISLPAVNCIPLRSDMAPSAAVLTEPLACVLHSSDMAAKTSARYRLDAVASEHAVRAVVILGAGPAGLLFYQHLRRVAGFQGTILMSELDAEKRALAAAMGAEVVDPRQEDLRQVVLDRTDGRRAEYLIEATGSGTVFAEIPALIRKQATVLLYGVGHGGASLDLLNHVQWKEPSLVVSVGGSGGFDDDGRPSVYRRSLALLENGTIDTAPIVTHHYQGLTSVPTAFSGDHRQSGYVKGVVLL
jgi:threonine dehydrogenase-like Zn-dependent dehydrogenase